MDTKVNYYKIGIFVISFFILLLTFIFWLGKFGLENVKSDHYVIYINESVSGLNVESAVKFKGVEVGKVEEIKINPNNSEQIQINIKVDKGTPIKEDNFATLGTLGLTGLKYIELKGGSKSSELLEENSSGEKVIKAKISVFASLENSTESISKQINEVLIQMKKLFNNKNLNNISQILNKTQQITQNIEKFSKYIISKEKSLNEILININNITTKGTNSFKNMSNAAQQVNNAANSIKLLSNTLTDEIKKGTYDIKSISEDTIYKMNRTLDTLEDTVIKTQNLIENISNSPSDIIFKKEIKKLGPGE
ncbi:ABC transporter substrate-binding protein [Malaciobacter molluscorum LMG 25693]|uniref:ABC transporter substrate-binding protein n=1 Tax=Malaciobacter molluscorum LMG 25693 TaxID=870501 RepID=A0A2G1DF85_9BACT|nr:MlaD family protein [Malaciobacter molluscorum]AXX91260.1 lipid asymmetry ABC transporter MlaABCDEF, periplasmic component MlaD [Malaciobacter molluscorum LMG 25693]PHO17149.1 ABC transporter substrate-binding protein [Malaciobacter molluscorum LMG 25693]